jgi:hypothetical protein
VDELDLRIRSHVYSSFVRDRHARTPAEAAAELGLDADEVAAAYRRLHDAHALVLRAGTTEIAMLNPFSAGETPHRVEAGGRTWYGNCAWDALGILGALHLDDGHVTSECPDCGELLQLEVRGGTLVRGDDLVVHFVVPARRWWDDIGFT